MANYLYAADGKIHTRYSELTRCTPGQIDRVLAERVDGFQRFESEDMEWGTLRHDIWAAEGLKTGVIAACFDNIDLGPTAWRGPVGFKCGDFLASHIEQEFTTEILPGVIAHSRPDVVSIPAEAVIDYKTLIADDLEDGFIKAHRIYNASRQLPFYALQLGLHGIRIRRALYLVEIWDKPRNNILGYCIIEKQLRMEEIAKVLPWVQGRVSMLVAALEERAAV